MVDCPICSRSVKESNINAHIDSNCEYFVESEISEGSDHGNGINSSSDQNATSQTPAKSFSSFFQKPTTPRTQSFSDTVPHTVSTVKSEARESNGSVEDETGTTPSASNALKRSFDESTQGSSKSTQPANEMIKRVKVNPLDKVAPLAERMRPKTLDDVCGQELVGPNGVLRGLIEANRVPSMILWGGPGTGEQTTGKQFLQLF